MDESSIFQTLRSIVDPGLSESIVDLGWIQRVQLSSGTRVTVDLTLPTPHYPDAAGIAAQIQKAIQALPGIQKVDVRWIWDPPWTPYRMSTALRASLGLSDQEPIDFREASTGTRARLSRWFGR